MHSLFSLVQNIASDPVFYAGCILSFFAVFGFLIFLRGFLAGAGYVYLNDGHAEHQDHANTRVTWGLFMVFVCFVFWEILRLFASWFGLSDANKTLSWSILIGIVLIWIFSTLKGFIKNMTAGGGGHH